MTTAAGSTSDPGFMRCPNCGAEDRWPPTISDDGTTTCPKCGHRFPVDDQVRANGAAVGVVPGRGLADAKGGRDAGSSR